MRNFDYKEEIKKNETKEKVFYKKDQGINDQKINEKKETIEEKKKNQIAYYFKEFKRKFWSNKP